MATTYLSTKLNKYGIYPIKKEHSNTIVYRIPGAPHHYYLAGFNSKWNTYIMKPSVGHHKDSPGTDFPIDTVEENIGKTEPKIVSALQKDRQIISPSSSGGFSKTIKPKNIENFLQNGGETFKAVSIHKSYKHKGGRKSKKLNKRRKKQNKTKRRKKQNKTKRRNNRK